ncbi:MAG: nucleoside triphosphate pyrophosphohydrolase, partial [Rhodoferax sp.]|nr:nucleoside triphosphate pyrophosphohydrolase [Rhodoferax sp.]
IKHLIEETYEVVDAIESLDANDPATEEALIEELGDLLYQVEFHATIAEQQGRFSMADVARSIHDKLVRRHPHVFGDVVASSANDVVQTWDEVKRAEKKSADGAASSTFTGVAKSGP